MIRQESVITFSQADGQNIILNIKGKNKNFYIIGLHKSEAY
jgi:hypothetical protein